MAVTVESTPNPTARKFTVGTSVGGPATFTTADGTTGWVASILELPGVASVFMTANFVTVTGDATVDWDAITPDIVTTLEDAF